jgi:transcriptional regulator with XRE-family HTH domain
MINTIFILREFCRPGKTNHKTVNNLFCFKTILLKKITILSMILTHIRSNIKRLRKSKGITQREMSLRLFMDERTYAKMERGTNKSMDIRILSSIAEVLETDITELLREPADEKNNRQETSRGQKLKAAGPADQQDLLQEVRELKKVIKELADFQKKALQLISATSTSL